MIELLVTLVIVGVIMAFILTNTSRAKARSADVEIKTNLALIQSRMELLYDKNKNYGIETIYTNSGTGIFFNDKQIKSARVAAEKASGGTPMSCISSDDTIPINMPAKTWACSQKLKSMNNFWCVDYLGTSKQTNGNVTQTINGVNKTATSSIAGIIVCP